RVVDPTEDEGLDERRPRELAAAANEADTFGGPVRVGGQDGSEGVGEWGNRGRHRSPSGQRGLRNLMLPRRTPTQPPLSWDVWDQSPARIVLVPDRATLPR